MRKKADMFYLPFVVTLPDAAFQADQGDYNIVLTDATPYFEKVRLPVLIFGMSHDLR